MDEEDYEAQRQANIKANLELMRELGLYQGSSSLFQTPKKASIAAKAKPKPASKSVSADAEEYESSAARVQRPRRITRSVSRTLDSPQKPKGRGMKRALSDNAVYPAKVSRSRIDKYSAESDSDDDYHSHRRPSRTSHNTLNPARHYRSSSELQRSADRLGVRIHNPKTFGAIPGIPIGTLWSKRIDCSTDAVHAPTVAGISGNEHLGCWSICLSGGYEDDIDLGETFTYTGSGGRDLKGTKQNPKNLRTARQSSDQKWEGKNAALQKSVKTGKVVRVVRGWKAGGRYAPREGYVYCGLYRVERCWMERGRSGFRVCRFEFRRVEGQDPLPTFDEEEEEELSEEEDEAKEQEEPSPAANNVIELVSPSPSPAPSSLSTHSFTSPPLSPAPHPQILLLLLLRQSLVHHHHRRRRRTPPHRHLFLFIVVCIGGRGRGDPHDVGSGESEGGSVDGERGEEECKAGEEEIDLGLG
ncbi:YDG domain-containing protein [Pseudozyma hubeiensis]|nr:YDG domain-containing protein [Pseudozyma hubeiensis]